MSFIINNMNGYPDLSPSGLARDWPVSMSDA